MYLGDGKFIDATTYQTPMVRIDDLDDAALVAAAGGHAESRNEPPELSEDALRWRRPAGAVRSGRLAAPASTPKSCV